MKNNQFYKIPKGEIDLLVDLANLGIDIHKETPMNEKSIEMRAWLCVLQLIVDKSILENE